MERLTSQDLFFGEHGVGANHSHKLVEVDCTGAVAICAAGAIMSACAVAHCFRLCSPISANNASVSGDRCSLIISKNSSMSIVPLPLFAVRDTQRSAHPNARLVWRLSSSTYSISTASNRALNFRKCAGVTVTQTQQHNNNTFCKSVGIHHVRIGHRHFPARTE